MNCSAPKEYKVNIGHFQMKDSRLTAVQCTQEITQGWPHHTWDSRGRMVTPARL